ncbi:hypothetical protein KZ483_25805 [Paenibacillus sp. sptzw28]|uniref:hypothetical protein n=1 Tax=Paenibacillus sp. sptzw28 TaxID=715179 RepID=UPI001C6E7938|nr:hypothetical protein [Paenibacillus sp. sptzw28]QYR21093.1 hypothetical protein KZ483_25805 [Paenibacillus sp. sptzw28]
MWFGKNKDRSDRVESGRRDKHGPNANETKSKDSRIRLDKPARSALWGTTTLVGKQKK